MGYQVGPACVTSQWAAAPLMLAHNGIDIRSEPFTHPQTGQHYDALPCNWANAQPVSEFQYSLTRVCHVPGEGAWEAYTITNDFIPCSTEAIEADLYEASLLVFAAGLACLAVVWGGKQLYALLTHSRAD